jgi:cysteine desulfurase
MEAYAAMIYLDNHASTRCDPRVVEAMVPWFSEFYGNPHSSHEAGRLAADAIGASIQEIATLLHARADSVLITSGATESNNLAIRGVCTHPRQRRRKIVTVTSEHPAVLDVVKNLEAEGFQAVRVPVIPQGRDGAGSVDLNRLAEAVDDQTALVSVMWANNEIGAVNPMRQVSEICQRQGALLHSDATQAVGRIPVDLESVPIDLLSATAHKFYGPKGVGILLAGCGNQRVRLRPQIVGGGQQHGLRSGTMNPAGVVGIRVALRLCIESLDQQAQRSRQLRDQLWNRLSAALQGLSLNGPALEGAGRLPGNLNLMLPAIDGQAWMSATPQILFSSGSACSAHEPAPSHVLTALGLSESEARRSVRFGVGRFNSDQDLQTASDALIASYKALTER